MNAPLLVRRLSPTSQLPTRGTPQSIGYDVYADLPGYTNGMVIAVRQRKLIPLGIAMAVPPGTYGRLAPRSGLAVKRGIHVMAGVIDPDYRGEVQVLLLNTSDEPVFIQHGERVAQLILEVACTGPVIDVDTLHETTRGASGFGSTGQ